MITSPVATPVPKRGGEHSIYGIYIGGSTLDNSYKMKSKISCWYALQCRNMKTVSTIEQDLMNAGDSTVNPKFDSHLEPTKGSMTDIGKEQFVALLKCKVEEHGQESFMLLKVQMEKLLISLNILITTSLMQ